MADLSDTDDRIYCVEATGVAFKFRCPNALDDADLHARIRDWMKTEGFTVSGDVSTTLMPVHRN